MNLYFHWALPFWKRVLANAIFWGQTVRPMGALYYMPLFHAFGLNSVPYNLVRNMLLFLNLALFYQFAFCLSRSRWVALLAAFPIAFHSKLGYLAWGGAFIYDVLCGGFYFAALLYYVQRRKAGTPLELRQTMIFLALYICALDSKEMAVTLPVLVFSYELLFQARGRDLRNLIAQFLPTAGAGILTAIFILGKTGAGSLTDLEAYRPVFTWARFSESTTRFLNDLFYTERFTMSGLVVVWILLLVIGLIRIHDPRWMFLWVWITVTPLPIVFLPGRGGPMLYIVLGGWSVAAALACRFFVRRLAWLGKAVGIPRKAVMAGGLLLCAGAYAKQTANFEQYVYDGYRISGNKTFETIEQLKSLHLHPKAGSRIVFLNNPFPDSFDMQFIANLVWNDHSLQIALQQQFHFTDAALSQMDYLLDFSQGRLTVQKFPR